SHLAELARLLPGRASLRGWRDAVLEDLRVTGVHGNGALSPALQAALANTPTTVLAWGAMLVRRAFRIRRVRAPVQTLSRVIEAFAIPRVDLLKIDVEGAEEDVLLGLEPESWSRVRHVVVEVHDVEGRVGRIRDLMESHGLHVVIEQEARPLKRLLSM